MTRSKLLQKKSATTIAEPRTVCGIQKRKSIY